MTDAHASSKKRDEDYQRTRDTFNSLGIEDQVTFLAEATASLLARGLERVGQAAADGLDDIFGKQKARKQKAKKRRGPGPAEPETSEQQRSRGGARDTSDE